MTATLNRLAARLAPSAGRSNTDGDLLARFARDRDEAAFAVLVRRHGPTVLGVCRRILGNVADADDAFQAVFLVLVNRAADLGGRAVLGDWLHGVAVRVAMKARTSYARLRKRERQAAESRPELVPDPTPDEPSPWLDQELAALPERFRAPVVLCLIQDRPRNEVAAELGIPVGTLASRLDTARKRLAERLARHRLPLAFAGLLVPVPAALEGATVDRATDGAGVAIHQLANEVTRAMTVKTKWAALVAACVLTAAVGGVALTAGTGDRPVARRNAPVPEKAVPKWTQEFDAVYSLKAGEVVKVIPRAEQPAARRDFIRDQLETFEGVKPENMEAALKSREDQFSYVVVRDDKGKVTFSRTIGGLTAVPTNAPPKYLGIGILGVPYYLAEFRSFEISFDPALNESQFLDNPDFVIRKDVPRDKLIPALNKELGEKLKVKFTLELESTEREVWVVSGKPDIKPRAWRKAGQVDVYSDEANVNKESFNHAHNLTPGFETGGVKELVAQLRDFLDVNVMWTDDAPPAKPQFHWTYHWLKKPTAEEWKADRDPEKVFKTVAEQTGLTIKKETRKVPVLFIRPAK